jgi:Holliday junction resolvase
VCYSSETPTIKHPFILKGTCSIDVSPRSVLHCIASYAGQAHQFYWVHDPTTVQNARRAVYLAFDDKMEILADYLKIQGKRDARDFENAIAWVLWMLGFSVSNIGGTPRTSDAPDLIATTPKGHFLIIECTTGILKTDNKLSNLIDRAEKVRKMLSATGNDHFRVLPVIVTNKTREEIKGDLEQAQNAGVFVGTSDGFADLLNLTNVISDPDLLFERAERKVAEEITQQKSLFTSLEN